MKNPMWFAIAALFASLSASLPTQADFAVVEEKCTGEYGNGQSAVFHRAIYGAGPLNAEEQAKLASVLPFREDNRYYGRAMVNFSTLTYDQIKNQTSGIDRAGAVNIKRVSRNQVGITLAVGYAWSRNFRGDIEYFAVKNLNYNANPSLIGVGVPVRQLTSQIKNNTLLANVFYDFEGVYRFRPYLTAGLGASVNSVQASITPPPNSSGTVSRNARMMGFAWALGGGLRIGMFTRWFLDVNYRYIRLANGLAVSPVAGYKLTGSYNMNAVGVGINYLF